MARDVAGLELGMTLLEPGFTVAAPRRWRVGRLRPEVDPRLDEAVDTALHAAEWEVVELPLEDWEAATVAAGVLLVAEAWATHGALAGRAADRIGDDVVERLQFGRDVDEETRASAEAMHRAWTSRLDGWFAQVDFLATSTLAIFPPPLGHGEELLMARCTLPVNLAGVPALALPVPSSGPLPASLQLIGPANGEEELLSAGRVLEAATS
jgi:Asp-tRNA(Asn)/Glu-tRNA(Gln) amidotransferase A subunit family amidase